MLYANEVVLDYTGLGLEDVKAHDFRDRLFHPDDLERLRDERQNALSRGEPFEVEVRARRKNGQYRWFLVRYNRLRDDDGRIIRWYATGIDIDDRKQVEERVEKENLALRDEIDHSSMFEEIVGSSGSLRKVLTQVAKVAPVDSTVLILGETGTGKELIARAIHKRSKRASRAFIRVIARRSRNRLSLPNCSDTRKAPSPARCKGVWDGLSWPTAGRFSWTRSASCRPRRRSRYCACSRRGIRACREQPNAFRRRARARRYQARLEGCRGHGGVPSGSLLSAERLSNPDARFARTGRRKPVARRILYRALR